MPNRKHFLLIVNIKSFLFVQTMNNEICTVIIIIINSSTHLRTTKNKIDVIKCNTDTYYMKKLQ